MIEVSVYFLSKLSCDFLDALIAARFAQRVVAALQRLQVHGLELTFHDWHFNRGSLVELNVDKTPDTTRA